MVKKIKTAPPEPLCDIATPRAPLTQPHRAESSKAGPSASLRQPLKRYAFLALTLAVVSGGLLMLSGHIALGKGLIWGALFSIVNFVLMAVALPLHIGRGRGPSTMICLASIALRYALLATPLIVALNRSQFAVTSTAAGLFMVPLTIFVDKTWLARRRFAGTEE